MYRGSCGALKRFKSPMYSSLELLRRRYAAPTELPAISVTATIKILLLRSIIAIFQTCKLQGHASGDLAATPENPAAFWEEDLKNSLFRFQIMLLSMMQSRLLESFLVRNERVATPIVFDFLRARAT